MIKKQIQSICGKISGAISRISANSSPAGEKLRKRLVLVAAVFAVALLVVRVASDINKKPVMVLYCGNEKMGWIASEKVYEIAKDSAEQYLAEKHSVAYRFPSDSAYYRISAKKSGKYLTQQQITSYLIKDAEKLFGDGYGLYIDGNLVVVGKDREGMENILDEILKVYGELYAKIKTPDDIVSFNSKTEIRTMSVPCTMIKSDEEIRSIIGLDSLSNLNEILLMDNSETEQLSLCDISAVIPELDNITDVDISLGLPAQNIYYVGTPYDEAIQSAGYEATSTMSFRSSSREVTREVVPYAEEIIYDDTLYSDEKILENNGIFGIKESVYETTYINGAENTRTLISEEIIKEPVAKVYRVGTNKRVTVKNNVVTAAAPATAGSTPATPTKTFIFPASGTITSAFQGRKLFGRYEFHGALDIANKVGTTIMASDGGTVTFAGKFSTYGKCVIIDHGDGYETLYAHLNKITVKEGDSVGQGWKVGEMGKTGRVTGSHLHFEVRVDGERVDPMDYLSK